MINKIYKVKSAGPLRHELKHQITRQDDLVLSQRLRKIFKHDKNANDSGEYAITSLYFDSPYDKAYQDKINGVNHREKFRIRYYGNDLSFIKLEKKYKTNGLCGKLSTKLTIDEVRALLSLDCNFLLNSNDPLKIELYSKIKGAGLSPKTVVKYDREAFIYEPGNVRITLDRKVRTSLNYQTFLDPGYSYHTILETTVLEVKYDEFLPDIVRCAVQVQNRRASACSKYTLSRFYE